jgi:hypothetical protein
MKCSHLVIWRPGALYWCDFLCVVSVFSATFASSAGLVQSFFPSSVGLSSSFFSSTGLGSSARLVRLLSWTLLDLDLGRWKKILLFSRSQTIMLFLSLLLLVRIQVLKNKKGSLFNLTSHQNTEFFFPPPFPYLSSPQFSGEGHRTETPWSKDYDTSVVEMKLPLLLTSTITVLFFFGIRV